METYLDRSERDLTNWTRGQRGTAGPAGWSLTRVVPAGAEAGPERPLAGLLGRTGGSARGGPVAGEPDAVTAV